MSLRAGSFPEGQIRHFFGFAMVDRSAHLRKDAAWIAERLTDPNSRFLPVWRERNLFIAKAREPRAAFLKPDQLSADLGTAVLLGQDEARAYFALDISAIEQPLAVLAHEEDLAFHDLRQMGWLVERFEGSLLAYARGMTWWHRRHLFCGVCGSPTLVEHAGHIRRCPNADCGATHFPRTDPAVIMLVEDGDRILLGRQASWPSGRYSVLAGFVEPGESLEDAVAREVAEESGILVDRVTYHSSQPWPFPASIMLGFTARARTTEIKIDPEELEEARWFERDWLLQHQEESDFFSPAAEFGLPPRSSIARALIDSWLER